MSVNRMLDVFSMVVPEKEEGFLKMLFAPAPPEKISVEDISGEKLFEEVKMASESAEALISDPLERLESMENEKSELSMQAEILKKITSLDFSVEVLGKGHFVNMVMGIAGKKDFSQLKAEIEEVCGGICFFAETAVSETESCILVISLLKDEDEILSLLRKWDVERINPGSLKGTPTSVIAGIDGRIVEINAEQEKCRQAIGRATEKWRYIQILQKQKVLL
jgi:vacuolar-type H+-ATPase subunit I/STV1